jgi:hypothetical protein
MKYLIPILLFGLIGCSQSQQKEPLPPNILDSDEMVSLLVDLQLLEGANSIKMFQGDTGQTNYNLLYTTVFNKHGIQKETFDTCMTYYTHHGEDMEKIYDRVIEELMKLEAKEKLENRPESVGPPEE